MMEGKNNGCLIAFVSVLITALFLGMASAWSELATMGDEVGMELDNANNNMLEVAESYGYERRNVTEVDFLEGVK
ncbi:MAG: hypothetical protein IJL92_06370 [Thermoguttaceae bacterium]|nr:hypothetical protein [Thermoguttaceae bacterium]